MAEKQKKLTGIPKRRGGKRETGGGNRQTSRSWKPPSGQKAIQSGSGQPDLFHIAPDLHPLVRSTSDLEFLVNNPLNHPEGQVEDLKASLRQFGQVEPLIVNKRKTPPVVIGGNGRLQAALSLGWTHIAVVFVDLDDAKANTLAITLNRTQEGGEWNKDALDKLLRDLNTGNDERLDAMMAELAEDVGLIPKMESEAEEGPEPQIDKADELQQQWNTQAGQLWLIPSKTVSGKAHRLLCGDSTKEADVAQVIGADKPFLMVTDPPYGVNYDASWREDYDQFERHSKGLVANDNQVDWGQAWQLFSGDVAYVWHAGVFAASVAMQLEQAKFQIRNQIIWTKQHFVFGRGAYHWQHEPCWYAVKKGKNARWSGDRKQSTVWEIRNANPMGGSDREEKTTHGTEKPIECMARPIRNHGDQGDIVYDPFLGSGTTMVAGEQLGRLVYGLEIEPKYVAVILQRLADMGLEPQLEKSEPKKNAA